MLLFSAKQVGLTLAEMDDLTIGQVVDYIINWNNLHDHEPEGTTTQATQEHWDGL